MNHTITGADGIKYFPKPGTLNSQMSIDEWMSPIRDKFDTMEIVVERYVVLK